jgi:hypothetical protein
MKMLGLSTYLNDGMKRHQSIHMDNKYMSDLYRGEWELSLR